MVAASIPYLWLVGLMCVWGVAPLLLGIVIRKCAPSIAAKIAQPLNLISTVSFIAAVILSISVKKAAMGQVGLAGVAAMLILILGSMVIGWVLAGPDKGLRARVGHYHVQSQCGDMLGDCKHGIRQQRCGPCDLGFPGAGGTAEPNFYPFIMASRKSARQVPTDRQ